MIRVLPRKRDYGSSFSPIRGWGCSIRMCLQCLPGTSTAHAEIVQVRGLWHLYLSIPMKEITNRTRSQCEMQKFGWNCFFKKYYSEIMQYHSSSDLTMNAIWNVFNHNLWNLLKLSLNARWTILIQILLSCQFSSHHLPFLIYQFVLLNYFLIPHLNNLYRWNAQNHARANSSHDLSGGSKSSLSNLWAHLTPHFLSRSFSSEQVFLLCFFSVSLFWVLFFMSDRPRYNAEWRETDPPSLLCQLCILGEAGGLVKPWATWERGRSIISAWNREALYPCIITPALSFQIGNALECVGVLTTVSVIRECCTDGILPREMVMTCSSADVLAPLAKNSFTTSSSLLIPTEYSRECEAKRAISICERGTICPSHFTMLSCRSKWKLRDSVWISD